MEAGYNLKEGKNRGEFGWRPSARTTSKNSCKIEAGTFYKLSCMGVKPIHVVRPVIPAWGFSLLSMPV